MCVFLRLCVPGVTERGEELQNFHQFLIFYFFLYVLRAHFSTKMMKIEPLKTLSLSFDLK